LIIRGKLVGGSAWRVLARQARRNAAADHPGVQFSDGPAASPDEQKRENGVNQTRRAGQQHAAAEGCGSQ
jgi:hypothetical protein